MYDVPTDTPVTTPVFEPTVAIPVLLLLHVPPGIGLVTSAVLPTHTWQPDEGQAIGPGAGVTVTTTVAEQPVDSV